MYPVLGKANTTLVRALVVSASAPSFSSITQHRHLFLRPRVSSGIELAKNGCSLLRFAQDQQKSGTQIQYVLSIACLYRRLQWTLRRFAQRVTDGIALSWTFLDQKITETGSSVNDSINPSYFPLRFAERAMPRA